MVRCRFPNTLIVLIAALVMAVACSIEPTATVPVAPTPTPTPTTVDVLRRNADEFKYAIGEGGGALTFATISEPLTFNLAIANDASSSGVLGYLFEGLTETSWLTDQVEPTLAESWERSGDGLTWTFHLRRDVTWHDGEPFTAGDVDFTFNRITYNDDIPASSRPLFHFRHLDENGEWQESPMTVTALDDYTVECVLPVPFAPFLRSMGDAIYPRHILEKHVDDGTFASTWDINTDPSEIIGTGPFTIGSYEPGERVVMRRNPDYWLEDDAGNSLPYLDEVVHVIVPDLETELAKFLAGESDSHGVLGRRVRRARTAAGGRKLHDKQARPRLRDDVPRIQHEPRQGTRTPGNPTYRLRSLRGSATNSSVKPSRTPSTRRRSSGMCSTASATRSGPR